MHPETWLIEARSDRWACRLRLALLLGLAASGGQAMAQPIGQSALWLRADAITGVADGGAVSAWNDANGNGRSFEQSDSAKRPLLYTTGINTINDKPVLLFDGSNDFLQGNAASLTALQAQPGATAFIVRKANQTGTDYTLVSLSVGGLTSGRFFMGQGFIGGNNYLTGGRPGDTSGGNIGTLQTSPTTNTSWAVQAGSTRFTGAEFVATSFANGEQVGTSSGPSTATAFPNTPSQNGAIGANVSGTSQFFGGAVAEMILYPRVLTSAEQSVVDNYLGAKYALAILDNATANGNYNALDGSFRTDVLGIGRATNDSLATASGLGGLSLSGTLSTANTWLYAGNDGTANALVTSGTLPAGSVGYWDRLWNVATIGSVAGGDNLSLTFDWAAAGLTSQFDALTDKTTAGFALWSGTGTDVSGFSSVMAAATAVNTLDRTVTFSLTAADLASGENLTLVIVPEPEGFMLAGLGLTAAAWSSRRRVAG